MYELKIKKGNRWYTADLGEEKPAFNYQVNDIAELKDRQANYTQALKLPINSVNKQIFGYTDQLDVVSDVPYINMPCRLFLHDSSLAGVGSVIKLLRVANSYETQIISGTVDFFEVIKNKKINELNLGLFEFTLDTATYSVRNSVYAQAQSVGYYFDDGDNDYPLPFVFLMNIIEKIVTGAGFQFVTNITTDGAVDATTPFFNNTAITISTLNKSDDSDNLNVSGLDIAQQVLDEPEPYEFIVYPTITEDDANNNIKPFGDAWQYVTRVKGKLIISGSITMTAASAGNTVILSINGTKKGIYTTASTHTFTHEYTVNRFENYNIKVYLEGTADNPIPYVPITISGRINITVESDWSVFPKGSLLNIAENIDYKSQLELFKVFTQVFGATVLVDSATQKLHCYTMAQIYANKQYAVDWSDKVSDEIPEVSYNLDYAQENVIKYQENSNDGAFDEGVFTVSNQALPARKELFTVQVEAGVDTVAGGAIIPMFDDAGKFKQRKPHLVAIRTTGGTNIATHSIVGSQSMIDTFYSDLTDKMLDKAQLVEAMFNLTEKDIALYNSTINGMPYSFVPVYIQKFGGYFYINKINNFINGTTTKVELIKL
jgi:hypothetical protein